MKKADCERAIRHLCHEWAETTKRAAGELDHPSFSAFKSWLSSSGYGHYLNFRSTAGAEYDAELWFDQELKQSWRN